jgi:DNA-binding protein H-NS
VEKIDIAFKVKITENAARMFEKVIKEFATAQKAHDDKVAQQQQKDLTKREQKQQELETG